MVFAAHSRVVAGKLISLMCGPDMLSTSILTNIEEPDAIVDDNHSNSDAG